MNYTATRTSKQTRLAPKKPIAKPAPYKKFKYLKGKELVPDPFELGI